MSKQKTCSSCSRIFDCGDSLTKSCWCNQYPPIFEVDENKGCLCQTCLHIETKRKTDEYVNQISSTGLKKNIAAQLNKTQTYLYDIDYYIENGLWVFTAWHHLKRGTCCKSGCRHCPYGFKKHTT